MNCDTAFDLMTDADGSRSLALARHLDNCPRCRQMQATLAPALEFLAPAGADEAVYESAAPFAAAGSTGGRQPFITAEALAVARQCAAELTARTVAPRVRVQRLAARSLRYVAVFAAGLLLAFTLFETRQRATPPDAEKCTRHAAARTDAQRSAAETRALALSCAACHGSAQEPREQRSSVIKSRRPRDEELLQQLLRDETLVAMSETLSCRAASNFG
ncbi:MAG: hypothetical protein ACM3U2_08095 [Deltaproteobacteria bacterium]